MSQFIELTAVGGHATLVNVSCIVRVIPAGEGCIVVLLPHVASTSSNTTRLDVKESYQTVKRLISDNK